MKIVNLTDDQMFLGVKLKLFDVTDEQKERFFEIIRLSDFVYNWSLDRQQEYIDSQDLTDTMFPKLLSHFDLLRKFNYAKKNDESIKFVNKITKGAANAAIKNLCTAYNKFYDISLKDWNHPKYKTRKKNRNRYGVRNDGCYIIDGYLHIEGFPRKTKFKLNTHEYDNFGCVYGREIGTHIYDTTISFNGDDFFISFSYAVNKLHLTSDETDILGVDLGVHNTFALSDGRIYRQPDCSRIEKHISNTDRKISRCDKFRRRQATKERTNLSNIPKSNNQLKLEKKRRKLHHKLGNRRIQYYHKITKKLIEENHKAIVIEKIGVKRLIREHRHMSKALSQVYFYMIRHMFEYKSVKYNSLLLEANEEYPSSKICNKCGHIHSKLGSKRVFKCPNCGYEEDRDINAAINLSSLYKDYTNNDLTNLTFAWKRKYSF